MRRCLALLLVFSLVLGGLTATPSLALADHDKKIPPGQAKKYYLDLEKLWDKEWDDLFKELEKRLDEDQNMPLNIKFLTRAQVAYMLARQANEYAGFTKQEDILAQVADRGAIPVSYRKAVAYVISEDLMTYKELPNGKINFQPNKAASLGDLTWLSESREDNSLRRVQFSGTVRFRYSIGSKTWIALETNEGILRTAYFPAGSVPSGLEVGVYLTVKAEGYKIVESSYRQPNQGINLLSPNQSNIESGSSGFSPFGNDTYAGAALKQDTAEVWQGQYSLRVATNGFNPWQGVNVVYSGSGVTGPLTFSFYSKGASGLPFRVRVYDNTNAVYPNGGTLEFTGTGAWQRNVVTFTPAGNTRELSLQVTLNNNTASTVFWLDGLQLEQGSSASAWTVGGSTGQGVIQ